MPLVSRTFDQLIDFTRTSAATYVDATGKIVPTPASRNLLTFTQEFDNAPWFQSQVSVAANATTAPDGTFTADKLTESAASSLHTLIRTVTTTAAPHTWSCYFKAAERTFALLYHVETNAGVSINLLTGATGTPSGTVAPTASTVTNVGSGWYRLTMTVTATAATNDFRIYTATSLAGGAYTGNGTSGIFIWGAQLEANTTATDYTRNVGGVYPPRFDYDPVTLAPKGLLVEEQRTNLLTYSEQFNIPAAWTVSGSSISANVIVSPDGTVDGSKLVENTTSVAQFLVRQTYGSFVAGAYTFTFYAKAAERTWTYFEVGNTYANVNLSTGAVGATGQFSTGWTFGSASATAVGNGWYRCSITSTCTTPGSYFGGKIHAANADNSIAYAGTVGYGIFIWGAQLEAGAFATSYIPTVASQVTRTADVATITGANFSQWYNQSEGTFVVEHSPVGNISAVKYYLGVTDGTVNNYTAGFGASTARPSTVGGVVQAELDWINQATIGTIYKAAVTYKLNDFAACVNGGTVLTDTSGTLPTTVNQLVIGDLEANTNRRVNGHLRSIRYYPTRLTDAQLQALTA